jgi:hypothetical protein
VFLTVLEKRNSSVKWTMLGAYIDCFGFLYNIFVWPWIIFCRIDREVWDNLVVARSFSFGMQAVFHRRNDSMVPSQQRIYSWYIYQALHSVMKPSWSIVHIWILSFQNVAHNSWFIIPYKRTSIPRLSFYYSMYVRVLSTRPFWSWWPNSTRCTRCFLY